MLPVMCEADCKGNLGDIFDGTQAFVAAGIGDDVMDRLSDLREELGEVRKEIKDILAATDSLAEAYDQAHRMMAEAETERDHHTRAKMYDEAKRYINLRVTFEERHLNLRRRLDGLEREKARMEQMMAVFTNGKR